MTTYASYLVGKLKNIHMLFKKLVSTQPRIVKGDLVLCSAYEVFYVFFLGHVLSNQNTLSNLEDRTAGEA